MNIIITAHCVGRTFFGRGETGYFHHLIGVSSFVRMRERGSRHLPFITVPTRPVRLHSGAIALPRKFHGYPTRCKFAVTQNVVQNVEHIFVPYSDFRSYSRAVHRRSASNRNQSSEFCYSPRGVVLYRGCPERHSYILETPLKPIVLLCDIWTLHRHMLHASLKIFFCATTWCHFNFWSTNFSLVL